MATRACIYCVYAQQLPPVTVLRCAAVSRQWALAAEDYWAYHAEWKEKWIALLRAMSGKPTQRSLLPGSHMVASSGLDDAGSKECLGRLFTGEFPLNLPPAPVRHLAQWHRFETGHLVCEFQSLVLQAGQDRLIAGHGTNFENVAGMRPTTKPNPNPHP